MIKKGILLGLLSVSTSFASNDRYLDGQFITNRSNTLTIPAITDTLSTATLTETLTNKTISGSSNTISNIAASSSLTGQVAVTNGGTGAASLTSNGIVYGNGTSAVGSTSAGSQYQVFQAGSSGVPTVGALQLNQSAAVTGSLGLSNGGTGAATQSGAANNILPSQTGNTGYYLTTNGTNVSWAAANSAPNVVGSTGSPSLITASGGISFSSSVYTTYNFIAGSGGPVTITANPQISAGSTVGRTLTLYGTDNTNTVTINNGTGLALNGAWVGAQNSVINLLWNGTVWAETSRQ